jgi:hypothetical protein
LNDFLSAVKLIGKQRAGSNIRKAYDQPLSRQRILVSPDFSDEVKAELKRRYER